ncbi:MAG: response regulator transcription factor [bacterium]
MSINILVAEDDEMLQKLICDMLSQQGYKPIKAKNGQEAIDLFFSNMNIDLCILDIMMPIYNGYEVLEEIRRFSDVKVVMLTALTDEQSEIKGISQGANDYIAKPFSYPIFMARINGLLKSLKEDKSKTITEGFIVVNQINYEVSINEEKINFTNKEYNLLLYLINNKNIVLTREKILDEVWGFDYEGDIRTIDAHIKSVRKKLGICGNYIKTVRNLGYKFEVR